VATPRDDTAAGKPVAVPDEPIVPPAADGTPPVAPPEPEPHQPEPPKLRPTRISGTWVAVVVAIFVLIFLLVFILQNLADATVHFLGGSSTLPLGVALLFAAIGGALLVALVGAARIMQLRRQAKRVMR
jgi:uncharacterized integral membrane protein